ncbi:uncharacterized protein LOC100694395 isoform X2 [Oreochromis niloticus]|uniref:uncharacterized protein LOC100694395 isoform X2 n=1 Tax=Oreochromis niloticus TaxID=8128 RepID=UPI000904ED19|nr:uncharacterized protein LOC100694395 isoform X2 [Oreochromis niloticus]
MHERDLAGRHNTNARFVIETYPGRWALYAVTVGEVEPKPRPVQSQLNHTKQDMSLVFLMFSIVFFGSSSGIQTDEVCYGRRWQFPSNYTPLRYTGPIYFTQSNGGSVKVVINNGMAIDGRFRVSLGAIYVTNVTERDEGIYSVSSGGHQRHSVVELKVLECAEKVTRNYYYTWEYSIPRRAEILEFTPLHSPDQPKILWNRTDSQIRESRAEVRNGNWQLSYLTHADSGYYNFRDKDHSVLARVLLKVQEQTRHYETKWNEYLVIEYPRGAKKWTMTFTPEGKMEPKTLMDGSLIIKDNHFSGRIRAVIDGIVIDPAEIGDSGTFEFRDPEGNLILSAQLEVIPEMLPQIIFMVVTVLIVILVMVCCCCCCKKCCKRDKSAPQTAASPAPAVYYHNENEPACPSYSHPSALSYQPVNSHVSTQPSATSSEPPMYHKVNIHESPAQPEVAVPGKQASTPDPSVGPDFLLSDPEPRFELKGLDMPFAPSLTSDTTICDVYNSDKLNFL